MKLLIKLYSININVKQTQNTFEEFWERIGINNIGAIQQMQIMQIYKKSGNAS